MWVQPFSYLQYFPPNFNDPYLEIWFDGADYATFTKSGAGTLANGDDLAAWNDKSTGTTVKPSNSTGGKRPKYTSSVQNTKSGVSFDGANDLFTVNPITDLRSLAGCSLILVSKLGTTSNQIFMQAGAAASAAGSRNEVLVRVSSSNWQIGMGGGLGNTTGVTVDTSAHIHTVVFDGTLTGNSERLKYYQDGLQRTLNFTVNAGTTTSSDTSIIFMGENSGDTEDLNGYLLEVLIYTKAISAAERRRTHDYLFAKWGIPRAV
jgi:hypothetical protein